MKYIVIIIKEIRGDLCGEEDDQYIHFAYPGNRPVFSSEITHINVLHFDYKSSFFGAAFPCFDSGFLHMWKWKHIYDNLDSWIT